MMFRSLSAVFVIALSAVGSTQAVEPDLFSGMAWRNLGPARGGRSIAVAGSSARPNEYFFGATGGGIWKTEDGGKKWVPLPNRAFGTASVGALVVSPSDPDVIYAGTGERDIRGNISHGDGVYRSLNGGKSWEHVGLKSCQTISKIVVHPTMPTTAWVAAFGHVYGTNPERGVYKTIDGGLTWKQVLFESNRAGAVDLKIDPTNPKVLLAATWEAGRTPYSMNSGGAGSKLWKSEDGGETWADLSKNPGLPTTTLGKIGVAISPVDPQRYWAIIEAEEGGIFLSDDAGRTWTRTNSDRNWRQRAWYYTHITADPKSKDTVYALNVGLGKSTDGGKTFKGISVPHSDNHDLWIAPENPLRMINANDGGANVSVDGGQNWTEQNYPTAQFYHVTTDNAFPYRILGAQQDNSTIRIPSRKESGLVNEQDWTGTAGGESGYVAPKPDNPNLVFGGSYGGSMDWLNHVTNESKSVDPWPDNPMGHGAEDSAYRFQWTYPILWSKHNKNLLFTCSQFVMTSTDLGQSWKKISPDLTRNDRSTMGPSGGPITKDNTSVEYYGTVFTLAESPRDAKVLWAGSDDGLIHVTRDGGKTWINVTPKGMPRTGLVSMIEASRFSAGTAYAAIDNHENDDYSPIAYKTSDFGQTWMPINKGFAKDEFLRVIREDGRQPGLLYAGTERGVAISFDDGGNWQSLDLNLPVTPVHDLAWKDDDLIAATHGRAFWVLDDVTPLQQTAKDRSRKARAFAPKDAYRIRWGGTEASVGSNPRSGVLLSYYLPSEAKQISIAVTDAKGEVVARSVGSKKPGFQRSSLFLQYPAFKNLPGMVIWSGFPRPILAPPGVYTATFDIDGIKTSYKFRWLRDPRSAATDEDLVEQATFLRTVSNRINEANQAVQRCRDLRAKLKAEDPQFAQLTKIEEAIYQTKNRSGQDPLNFPIRLNDKLAGVFSHVGSGNGRPTKQARDVFALLSGELQIQLNRLAQIEKLSK